MKYYLHDNNLFHPSNFPNFKAFVLMQVCKLEEKENLEYPPQKGEFVILNNLTPPPCVSFAVIIVHAMCM